MSTFGLNLPAGIDLDPAGEGRRAEELGFDFVSTADHPEGTEPSHEVWTMLTWVAAATTRLKIATRVLGVPYRSPGLVAKMAETLDRLSGGRLILGLGGGYSDNEFRALGLNVPSPRDKVDGLAEAIQITRGLWSTPGFTFDGRLFRTESANLTPKPGHRIPIWVGTFGPRALAVTGRHADGWIPTLALAPPEQIPAMRTKIHEAARAAGRSPEAITFAYNLGVRVGGPATTDRGVVTGPPEAIAEQIHGFEALGFTAFNFQLPAENRAEQSERLAQEVLPLLREMSAAGSS
jgi:probable F420-dependent oxidoreductase